VTAYSSNNLLRPAEPSLNETLMRKA